MRIGMALNYAGGFAETVAELGDYEKAGLDMVWVALAGVAAGVVVFGPLLEEA